MGVGLGPDWPHSAQRTASSLDVWDVFTTSYCYSHLSLPTTLRVLALGPAWVMLQQIFSAWKAGGGAVFGCFVPLSCTPGPLGLAPAPSCPFLVLSEGHKGHLNT